MLVMKFGGTSVSSKQSVLTICDLVKKEAANSPIVVVSALSKVTDMLVDLCQFANLDQMDVILAEIREKHYKLSNELLDKLGLATVITYIDIQIAEIKKILSAYFNNTTEVSLELKDQIISFGEKLASFLISEVISFHAKIKAVQVVASNCIITNRNFGNADYILKNTQKNTREVILPLLEKKIVPVVAGFIAATENGELTTLGRGGSDYTATIIGRVLNADLIQIWTDVDGIFTSDPKMNKDAELIKILSFEEAIKLAKLGAKVLHPKTVEPAVFAEIPIQVLNTFNPEAKGSIIIAASQKESLEG